MAAQSVESVDGGRQAWSAWLRCVPGWCSPITSTTSRASCCSRPAQRLPRVFFKLLADRRVKTVVLGTDEDSTAATCSDPADRVSKAMANELVSLRAPAAGGPEPRLSFADLRARHRLASSNMRPSAKKTSEICETLVRGRIVAGDEAQRLVGSFADRVKLDRDLLTTIVALQTAPARSTCSTIA